MALEPNIGLWVVIGAAAAVGHLPKVTTAATMLAYWAGSAVPLRRPPTESPVTMSITDAPCEYPPSTCGVFGHLSAMDLMCDTASLEPSSVCNWSEACLVVHRIHADVHAGLLAQRVHEGLADAPDAGRLVGAAGEGHLDVRAVVGAGRGDAARDSAWRDQQNTGGQHRGGGQGHRSG